MSTDGKNNSSDLWASQTLEHLKRDGLVATPENYAVFYHYYTGDNPNLKMAMDMLLGSHDSLTQAHCSDLYQTHLGLEAEHQIIKKANDAINSELKNVLGVIDTATAGTTHYTETLDTLSGQLTSTESMGQIREAVTKVVGETHAMIKQNERLQGQLAQTTQQLTEMRFNLDKAHEESKTDPLTNVGNRKFFNEELARALAEARETKTPLTLLMVDIDHFKKFNDSYGHLIGDQVLRLVARTLVENLKGRDVIARYGGEEFVILLPQTRVHDAEKVANQLRTSLGSKQLKRRNTNETLGVICISIGAAEYCVGEESDNFISRADSALYRAKQTGRNRVVNDILTPEQIAEITAGQV